MPGYPVTPILFCLSCSFMVYSSVAYAVENRSWEAIWSIAILLVGVALSFYRPGSTPSGQSDFDGLFGMNAAIRRESRGE